MMISPKTILCFVDQIEQSQQLANALNITCQTINIHRFPDGEIKLTLPQNLPAHIIIYCSLNDPNEKLIALLLAAETAKKLEVKTLTLVTPYLCYMRQDIAFHAGEAVSQTIIGKFLANLFENIITVDPHLHRIQHLSQAVPAKNAISLSATSLMATFLSQRFKAPVLLAPDSEAEQWVKAVANPNGWEYGVCQKIRTGDKQVNITLPNLNLKKRQVIVVDDVASSGQTIIETIKLCLLQNAAEVNILVTHALFGEEIHLSMKNAGASHIWSTDSVTHPTNQIKICNLLEQAISNL
ncbi:MAG: ribose-phosphate diphosphokinase [Methylotenera sp.]